MFLSGDRNLLLNGEAISTGLVIIKASDALGWTGEIHRNAGNLGLADGSVQQLTDNGLQQLNKHAGTNVYRLAIP